MLPLQPPSGVARTGSNMQPAVTAAITYIKRTLLGTPRASTTPPMYPSHRWVKGYPK